MKKINGWKAAAMVLAAAFLPVSMGNCAAAEPGAFQFSRENYILPALGETFDASAELSAGNEGADVVYMVFDEAVASVSEEGIVTANGCGVTTLIASLASDDTVSDSMDVTVAELYGTYHGEKHIDAMDCDILVDLTLEDDGTFTYYRAPMVIQMDGGGQMPEMEDKGTYVLEGTQMTFTGEELGEYTLELEVKEDKAVLCGKLPTGGAPTELEMEKIEEGQADTEIETETE